jgi:hypothetical protein
LLGTESKHMPMICPEIQSFFNAFFESRHVLREGVAPPEPSSVEYMKTAPGVN